MGETMRRLGLGALRALSAAAMATAVALGVLTTAPTLAQAAETDAGQEIYAIFYDNPDGKSYTLVIQNGDDLDPAYPKPSDDQVILVCGKGKCNCGSWSSGEFSPYTTCVRTKSDVAPHSLESWFSNFSALKTADLSGLKTFQATNMRHMFAYCSSLDTLDLSGFDTARVTDMGGMFDGCSSLELLNMSSFDASCVTDMGNMFAHCSSLKALEFGGKFKTDSVTYMGYMFVGCSSLKTLDLSGFNTSKVRGMNGMLYDCSSLASISFSPEFTTSRVTGMDSMFAGCASLRTLDLSSFDMTFVTATGEMLPSGVRKIVLPATGDFSKIGLPRWTQADDFRMLEIKWRNEKGQVFSADAIPAYTAGAYTAVIEDSAGPDAGAVAPSQPATRKTSLASAKVTVPARAWTGKAQKPAVTVKVGGKTLREGRDYAVSCKAAKNVGSYKVTVKGKGSYTGTKTAAFKINPKGTSAKKLKKAKRGFTVTWKKPSKANLKQTTGYQVRWSLKKSMKGAKSKTVKATSSAGKRCSLKVTKLKGGKKYYVQVRAYKKAGGKTYYSSWSKAKAVKTVAEKALPRRSQAGAVA